MIVSYTLIFAVMVCVFKDPSVRTNDLLIASGTMVSALTGYIIVSGLRFKQRVSIKHLRYLSETDSLTGLYNKRTFENACHSYLDVCDGSEEYALLFFDIDYFKLINDTYGHQKGDAVLHAVAVNMQNYFYEKDLLCRFGGDEFIVFLLDAKDADEIGERIRGFQAKIKSLAKPLGVDTLTCSMGVAMKANLHESYVDLISRADAALYLAKQNGRDCICVADDILPYAEKHADNLGVHKFTNLSEIKKDGQSRRRVLIIDDNSINRASLARILEAEFDVFEAEDGLTGLDMMLNADTQFSVVLLDILMPGMDGYEVLRKMRKNEKLSSIPVLVVTVDGTCNSELKAFECGASDFIIKPYRPAIIVHRIENLIRLSEMS